MSLGTGDAAIGIAHDPLNGASVLLVGTREGVLKGFGAVVRTSLEAHSLAAALQSAALIWKDAK